MRKVWDIRVVVRIKYEIFHLKISLIVRIGFLFGFVLRPSFAHFFFGQGMVLKRFPWINLISGFGKINYCSLSLDIGQ